MTNTEQQEIWKTYPKIPFIQVSNLGKIRTIDRYVTVKGRGKRFIKGRVLKQQLNPHGYMQVHVKVNGKSINLRVHRLVAITFIPNPHGYPEVNHKDNDRTNNAVSNLEWCTPEYNIAYREKYGIALNRPVFAVDLETGKILRFESQSEAARQLGVDVGNLNNVVNGKMIQIGGYWFTEDENKITEEKIQEIKAKMQPRSHPIIAVNPETREVFWFESQHEAGRNLGVCQGSVGHVLKGQRNKAGGCWFCYADENTIEKTRVKFGYEVASQVEKLMSENCD